MTAAPADAATVTVTREMLEKQATFLHHFRNMDPGMQLNVFKSPPSYLCVRRLSSVRMALCGRH